MKKAIAIFGYNNTRIYDVIKLKELIQKNYQAEMVLIKEGVSSEDLAVTPFCFDAKIEEPISEKMLRPFLDSHSLELIGCLPFSDKGVIGGAFVAEELNLFADDSKTSFAMLDKSKFRELEKQFSNQNLNYKKPFFCQVYTKDDLFRVFEQYGPFFIKPTSEGNSRGCMKITSMDDLQGWINDYASALKSGVICEENLSEGNEYSFDGVAGKYWITKKYTTQGAYRAEYQHIVPAPLSVQENQNILRTMSQLLPFLGSRGGAFHHEFFILKDGKLASVEPNRRPAGMWIWDLAENSFKNFHPWKAWIDRATSKKPIDFEKASLLEKDIYSGVRAVIAPTSGRLTKIDLEKMESLLKDTFGENFLRFSFLKKSGDFVKKHPKDNSDFLAFVSFQNQDSQVLEKQLEEAEKMILRNLEIVP